MNSYITSGHKEKLILLPGYTVNAAEIEKLGLDSLKIPHLFLAEKLTAQPLVHHTPDQDSTPTSPPGLVHPAGGGLTTGSYKSAVQSKSDDNYTRWTTVGADSFDAASTGSNGRVLRKTNPRLVRLLISICHGAETDDPPRLLC